jgi:Protein of unknown function (DUF4245)
VSTATTAPARPAKKKRGQETVRDMVLSLLVCIGLVVPVWYLAQPPASDSKAIRVIDPTADVRAFAQAAPGVPVPREVPAGWQPTSSTLQGASLRIGYVTPGDSYVEYAAQGGALGTFVGDQTGQGTAGSPLQVGARTFRVFSDRDEHTSLVLQSTAGTVVVGGLRETADDALLTTLAGTLR